MSIKRLIFQKGGIGTSMSRKETVARLNPIIEAHLKLNLAYRFAIDHLSDDNVVTALKQQQRTARMDVGKLSETVLSCGGIAFNGVSLNPTDYALDESNDAMLFELLDRERAFNDEVKAELSQPHQLRTEAIINNVLANSEARLGVLREQTKRRHRPREAAQ